MRPASDVLWERWDEVDRLLAEAMELPVGDRDAFVRRATRDDAALRDLALRLVDRMSAGHSRVTAPPDAVVAGAFGTGEEDPLPDLAPGAPVGRYVIVGRRARGGMATVYEAERSDGVYQQRVALKVLRRGLDTEDLIRRFRLERQILSSLSHPHIARLFDGGSTPDGRPYLVMELVDGQPIIAYADALRLDAAARLALFLGVAEAVHAAHQQLVVHRDIKPSNVLVGQDGRVKLLDFGIAKLLTGDSEHTEGGLRALTPDYASPEQLRGEPITTATDVYQLGLLLRELLTGVRPLAGETRPGEAPLRPSRAAVVELRGADPPEVRAAARSTTPPRLARRLRGDLDIIVGKALRSDPAERYRSADELALDVRRHLQGLPILAHPESAAYRLAKFVRRNRWSAGAAATSVLLLVLYAVTVTVQGRKVAAAGEEVAREARAAEAVSDFLVQLFRSGNPTVARQDTVTVLGILEQGAERIRTSLTDQPGVRAAMLLALGRAFTGLGRFDRADTLLLESLALRREEHGPDHPRVADVLSALGSSHRSQRDFRSADRYYHEEWRIRAGDRGLTDQARARMLENLSQTQRDVGEVDSALALIREAVRLRRSEGDTSSAEYVGALGGLAYVLRATGELDSAEAVYREVLRRRVAAVGPDDNSLAQIYNNLGFLLMTRGEYPAAETEYREALRIARSTLGAGHPTSLMLSSNLAGVLERQERFDQVEVIHRDLVAAARRQWPERHWRVGSRHQALGTFLLRRERPAEALRPLEDAIASYTETLGPDHPWTVLSLAWRSMALLSLGRTSEAEVVLDRATAGLEEWRGRLEEDSRRGITRIADLLEAHGDGDRAAAFRRLLEPADSAPPRE